MSLLTSLLLLVDLCFFCAITSRCLICLNDETIKRSTEKTRMCLKPSVLPPFVVAVLRCVQSMKRKGARFKVEEENEFVVKR